MELSEDTKREIEKMIVKYVEKITESALDQVKSVSRSVQMQTDLALSAAMGLHIRATTAAMDKVDPPTKPAEG